MKVYESGLQILEWGSWTDAQCTLAVTNELNQLAFVKVEAKDFGYIFELEVQHFHRDERFISVIQYIRELSIFVVGKTTTVYFYTSIGELKFEVALNSFQCLTCKPFTLFNSTYISCEIRSTN